MGKKYIWYDYDKGEYVVEEPNSGLAGDLRHELKEIDRHIATLEDAREHVLKRLEELENPRT